jgi:hypothetical protein
MKKALLAVMLISLSMNMQAQQTYDAVVGRHAELPADAVPPKFPGGSEGIMRFIASKLKYPELAEKYLVQGRVVSTFIVNTDGSLSDSIQSKCTITSFSESKFSMLTDEEQAAMKKQFAKLFVKEAQRVIRQMPKWKPGMKKDAASGESKPVKVKMTIPITFKLDR